ncbi:hypothetical protein DNTS_006141 [Danionella cerebrum]|uniref:Uncharacterized protein n=1 Tax=Danionella cerebrum TaxID=2873325 RepID=A0A553RHK3_9TELE|nr:hypothetical protein DNTS_006141 [Danionella translucida]
MIVVLSLNQKLVSCDLEHPSSTRGQGLAFCAGRGCFLRGFGLHFHLRLSPPVIRGQRDSSAPSQALCPSCGMNSKDARAHEGLESGGNAACCCGNRRKFALVLVIQSLLTVACATFTLSNFLKESPQVSKDRGIFMQMIDADSGELSFHVIWNRSVHLPTKKRVKLDCPGPYIVYLWVDSELVDPEGVFNLTMEQGEKSFHLLTLQKNGHEETHAVVMLSEKSEIAVKMAPVRDNNPIYNLTLGIHHMLGEQCFDV